MDFKPGIVRVQPPNMGYPYIIYGLQQAQSLPRLIAFVNSEPKSVFILKYKINFKKF